jgi:hypothetical protein
MKAAASISGKGGGSPLDENPVFHETPGLKGEFGYIKQMPAFRRKAFIYNRFLFE